MPGYLFSLSYYIYFIYCLTLDNINTLNTRLEFWFHGNFYFTKLIPKADIFSI